jgi:hypothetical protein
MRSLTVKVLQSDRAPNHVGCTGAGLGDFSHTSPVSRSRTAALPQSDSTLNRLEAGNFWFQDGSE